MSILDIDFTRLETILAKDYPFGEDVYKPVLMMHNGELKIGLVSKQSGELLGVTIAMKDVLHE